jgi:hypothetical protein
MYSMYFLKLKGEKGVDLPEACERVDDAHDVSLTLGGFEVDAVAQGWKFLDLGP